MVVVVVGWGGWGWTRPIRLKAGPQDQAHHRALFIYYICVFYTSDGRSIVWLFSSLLLMLVKGKGGHCPLRPAGMFWAKRSESMWNRGPAKCPATLASLNAGLGLALVLVPIQFCVSLSLCLQHLPLSQIYMPSGLAPHLWISCLQSPDSSTLCAATLCALRHLPWLKSLYPCKRGKPINCVLCWMWHVVQPLLEHCL